MENGVFDTIQPVLLTAIAICIYTLISNFIFGHQTFWKPANVISSVKKVYSAGSLPQAASSIVVVRQLELLDDDSIFHCLSYLNAVELHNVSKVSKRIQLLSSNPVLWSDLLDKAYFYTQPQMRPVVSIQFSNVLSKKELFYALKSGFGPLLLDHLLQKRKIDETRPYKSLFVILHNDVLNLACFAGEHPGGEHILRHMDGTDATKFFELATHSDLAVELSKNFIIWSGKEVFGS